ncbi:MAG TPA: DUF1080 domain-containing protein [Longimicrobiaceae bacterium]|nr:DUF1080 domain-containing protein [Longimicrobiaceae bacterium]
MLLAPLGLLVLGACSSAASNETAGADATASPDTLAAADSSAGWEPLFDGHSLAGWRGLGLDSVPTAYWTVADGTIHKLASGQVPVQADGQPLVGADLMTEKTYRDFDLVFDWKISPGGNSGVKYNVDEKLSTSYPPNNAALGFEYQVLDDARHPDGKLPTHRSGALYDLVAPNAQKQLNPVGQWNHSEIILRGNHGEHWLNGKKVVEYDLGTPAMDSALAASKYHGIPGFADRRAGHIVLQDHGDEVWYRNVKIRELR